MLAIPSPDVLLNLFASAAQLLGLLALALGGGAFVRRRNSVGGGAAAPVARWPFFVTLGLLVGVSVAFFLYYTHVQDVTNQRLRTNLVRKSTEAQQAVGDTSLKTLSVSKQGQHPRGVSTETLDAWIRDGRALNLVDVREPEEVEMGQVPGTWARRYPDLQVDASGLVVDGKETVLLCESGNRSSELCDWFFERGVTTHFMVGGYEKWVAEYRQMTGQRADGAEIRATPDYPQKDVLLDTPEVLDLVQNHGAVFVDVRYPQDFARDHLPGAINLTLRKMLKAEADAAVTALPKRPIIAVCYDKRSSFYGLLLGLRLHRIGADFRGRYTVPQEFTLPDQAKENAWVAQWKADREGDTLFGRIGAAAGAVFALVADRTGLVLAILLLVVALRAAMLPFSLFAERDQWSQRRLAPRFAELRQRWAHDPHVWRRESLHLLRRAGVSPMRNMIGALLQIALFGIAFGAVNNVASARPTTLLWFDLATADATGVLPVLFGIVLAAFVRLQQQNKKKVVVPAIFVVGMVALVWSSNAGVLLYLTSSIALMAVQTIVQRRWLDRRSDRSPLPAPRDLVPLRRAVRHPDLGNKAHRLGKLLEATLPVPDGFVVPANVVPDAASLRRACERAGIRRAAVRSSAIGEDGAESSCAGMFLSELDVDPADLAASIARVRTSYGERSGGVVVQSFVNAQYAGVLFTVDPAHSGRMLVEMVAGCGDQLVSGRASPKAFRFGRASGELVGGERPPIALASLLELGRLAERLCGGPQDIEWVFTGEHFLLVQSRDITRLPGRTDDAAAALESERLALLRHVHDLPADEVALEQTEICELLPSPTTYSLALFQSLWEAGGTVDRACRASGIPYEVTVEDAPLVRQAFGRSFVDVRQQKARSRRTLGAVASFRLASSAQSIEEEWQRELPALQRRWRQLAAIDPSRLADDELLALCDEVRSEFVNETYVRAELVNVAAEYFVGAVRRRAKASGHDAAALLRDPDGNVTSRAFAALHGSGDARERVATFVRDFGHRAPHDFELAEPRYGEDRARVAAMAGNAGAAPRTTAPLDVARLPRLLATAVQRARRFQSLKEEAKHESMRALCVLRGLLRSVGERFGLADRVFFLTPSEVQQLRTTEFRAAAGAIVQRREARRDALLAVDVPAVLTPRTIECIDDGETTMAVATGDLTGACVAGSKPVVGRVRVLQSPDELGSLQNGEILVTRCTDPCWMSAFARAGGLVTEIGGWLSHAAIQAREHDLATIVGVADATRRLRTGDVVRLQRDGVVVLVPERRRPRRAVDLPGRLSVGERRESVRLLDLGDAGACIEVVAAEQLPETPFELTFADRTVVAALAWRNCTRAGVVFRDDRAAALAASRIAENPRR